MKTTKLAAKFFLINILFAANVLADDGQMNGGGKTCNPQVQTCLREEPAGETDSKTDSATDSMFDVIKEYLASWII